MFVSIMKLNVPPQSNCWPLPGHPYEKSLAPPLHPSCSKKKKKKKRDAPFAPFWHPHLRPRPLAPHVCGWLQIIIIDGELCPWKDISNPPPRKKKALKPVSHFQVMLGYIRNPVKLFWVLRLITGFNVGNNFTTTNASNILSEFPCSLMKVSHGFNTNKTKKKSWFL